jgi:hypothetical protein
MAVLHISYVSKTCYDFYAPLGHQEFDKFLNAEEIIRIRRVQPGLSITNTVMIKIILVHDGIY